MDDVIIQALVEIGNSPKVKKLCEPDVCFPFDLTEEAVIRVLKAQELLMKQMEKMK